MAADPNNRMVSIKIPLSSAKIMMTKGLADWLGLTIVAGWPVAPVLPKKKFGGLRTRAKASGKVAIIQLNTGKKYQIRYTGTFRRVYSYLSEVTVRWTDDVTEFYTMRKGSRVTETDASIAPD